MDGGGVSDIPSNGITNEGLETTPETTKKIFPARTSSTLTQVDLDILSAQAHGKTGEKQGPNISNSREGEGDPISQVDIYNDVVLRVLGNALTRSYVFTIS